MYPFDAPHTSAEVVENAAPWFCDRKYAAEVVENAPRGRGGIEEQRVQARGVDNGGQDEPIDMLGMALGV